MSDIDPALIQERTVSFWGEEFKVTPILVSEIFGDGKKLFVLQPLATRPDRYIVRGDSAWGEYSGDDNPFCDHLEEVYQAIESEYGSVDDERYSVENGDDEDETDSDHQARTDWPALNTSCGCCWWVIEPSTTEGEG